MGTGVGQLSVHGTIFIFLSIRVPSLLGWWIGEASVFATAAPPFSVPAQLLKLPLSISFFLMRHTTRTHVCTFVFACTLPFPSLPVRRRRARGQLVFGGVRGQQLPREVCDREREREENACLSCKCARSGRESYNRQCSAVLCCRSV